MNTQKNIIDASRPLSIGAGKTLNATVTFWFVIAVIGQWMFAYYIAAFYGSNAFQGNWEEWTKRMIHGIVEGDPIGNIAVVLHMFFAFVITFGGPLQLIPQVRNRFPKFHRINGRLYIFTAILISLGGIYMIRSRDAEVGGLWGQIATSGNGLFIIASAMMTIRTARNRNFEAHRRWAIRAFILVSGVWFFRLGYGLWIILNNFSAPGTNETLTGSFDMFLYYASYLLPLFFLELYFRAENRQDRMSKIMMSGLLLILTVFMAIGIFMAAQIFWLPNL